MVDTVKVMWGEGVPVWDKGASSLGNVYITKQFTSMPDSIIKQSLLFQVSKIRSRDVKKISRYQVKIPG